MINTFNNSLIVYPYSTNLIDLFYYLHNSKLQIMPVNIGMWKDQIITKYAS